MNNAAFHSAGKLDIELFINRLRVQRFVFTAASVELDVTNYTWQLIVKTNPGDRINKISLTLQDGLSFPTYEENVIEARFEATDTNIEEGQYYWALIRTDTNEPWINGWANFSFGPLSSGGSEQEITVNILDNTVSVELQSVVSINTIINNFGGLWNFASNGNAFPTADVAGKLYIAEDDHGVLGDPDYVPANAWMVSKVAGASTFSQFSYKL